MKTFSKELIKHELWHVCANITNGALYSVIEPNTKTGGLTTFAYWPEEVTETRQQECLSLMAGQQQAEPEVDTSSDRERMKAFTALEKTMAWDIYGEQVMAYHSLIDEATIEAWQEVLEDGRNVEIAFDEHIV